jgi:hypothetical protein
MNTLVKILSTETGNLGRRIAKFIRYGSDDVQTSISAQPFGTDANPVKDMVAVYAPTSEMGKTVIIGYLNPNAIAEIGGHRIYSTDANGAEKSIIYLRANGDAEINGADDNMVRFTKLKEAFDALKSDHNDLVTAFNTHMHPTAATGLPSPPTPGAGIPAQASTADISGAKIDNVKTNTGT